MNRDIRKILIFKIFLYWVVSISSANADEKNLDQKSKKSIEINFSVLNSLNPVTNYVNNDFKKPSNGNGTQNIIKKQPPAGYVTPNFASPPKRDDVLVQNKFPVVKNNLPKKIEESAKKATKKKSGVFSWIGKKINKVKEKKGNENIDNLISGIEQNSVQSNNINNTEKLTQKRIAVNNIKEQNNYLQTIREQNKSAPNKPQKNLNTIGDLVSSLIGKEAPKSNNPANNRAINNQKTSKTQRPQVPAAIPKILPITPNTLPPPRQLQTAKPLQTARSEIQKSQIYQPKITKPNLVEYKDYNYSNFSKPKDKADNITYSNTLESKSDLNEFNNRYYGKIIEDDKNPNVITIVDEKDIQLARNNRIFDNPDSSNIDNIGNVKTDRVYDDYSLIGKKLIDVSEEKPKTPPKSDFYKPDPEFLRINNLDKPNISDTPPNPKTYDHSNFIFNSGDEIKNMDMAKIYNESKIYSKRPAALTLSFVDETNDLDQKSKIEIENFISSLNGSDKIEIIGFISMDAFNSEKRLSLRRTITTRNIFIDSGLNANNIEIKPAIMTEIEDNWGKVNILLMLDLNKRSG